MNYFEEKMQSRIVNEITTELRCFINECLSCGMRYDELYRAIDQQYGGCVNIEQNFQHHAWDIIINIFNFRFAVTISRFEIENYRYGRGSMSIPDHLPAPVMAMPSDYELYGGLRDDNFMVAIWNTPSKLVEEVKLPIELFKID